MAMIRYSDDDRERMRREQDARSEAYRRQDLYSEFLQETGRMGVADRTPVSKESIEKTGGLNLRWRDRHTDGSSGS